MDRLTRYITFQFVAQALTIFLAGGVLIWLMQLLRLFDIVSAQGQNILTLMGQSALTTPTYARSILYVCLAIGIVRGLRSLQMSRELHTIHAGQRVDALWKAIIVFTLAGIVAVGAIAHVVEPRGRALSNAWSARIAADVVGRALSPGRFTEIAPGVVASARSRGPDGTLEGFFLDDTTNPARRTYFAQEARVYDDDGAFQLILDDGAIQYEGETGRGLSQIAFTQYHISLANLIDATSASGSIDQTDSLTLLGALGDAETADRPAILAALHSRNADMVRTLTFCVFVVALMAFPSGQRSGRQLPMELVVLLIAFAEQALSTFVGGGVFHYISPFVLLAGSLLLFWRRQSRARIGWRTPPVSRLKVAP